MKKFLSVLLISVMTVSVLFASGSGETAAPAESAVAVNPTGFPIVNEPLTLTVFGIRDNNQCPWKDMLVLKEYEKMTGIHMEYQETGDQGKDEKKNLLFASNELPDVFLRPMFKESEIARYGVESGQLMPLNDLIEQYCPNLKALLDQDPQYWKAIEAADGNIYCLPQVNMNEIGPISWKQWINKEWLAALDLELPTTTEELRDVLRAFRDGDPNGNGIKDEIPLGVREASSIYEVLIGSWGLHRYMNNTINLVDGKVDFWIDNPEFKDYLMYFNSLYEEGLLWVDYYKRDLPLWRSNLSNALFGAFWMPFSDVFLKVEDKFVGFEPLTPRESK